jgi:hypothetical protein
MCHKNPSIATPYARTRNATTGLFEPNATVDMNNVVRTVIKPVRSNCLFCHARAGGGDAVKRGDLALATGNTTDANYDVHMSTSRGNFACQNCHTYNNHRVTGRGVDLRPEDTTAEMSCSSVNCHPTKLNLSTSHTTADVSHHVGRVACQTCHLPRYAKDAVDVAPTASNPQELTEMHRDWTLPEWSTVNNRWEPTQEKLGNQIPKYLFWNGTSWGNNTFDNAVLDPATGKYKISRPLGAINDPAGTKLYPFKYKTSYQPLANGKLVAIKVGTYFATANFDQAVQDGLAYMGMAGAPYSMVTTDEYLLLNHQIPTKADVLACTDCHGSTTRMNLPDMGYAIKAPLTTICAQCHGVRNNPGLSIHDKHVNSTRAIDCSMCHNFSRATERNLKIGIQ